jgi:hypothetical protein
VCRSKANPLVMKVTDADESDDVYVCERLSDLAEAARIAYYTARIIALFA